MSDEPRTDVARLEDLTAGAEVEGVLRGQLVEIVAVQWHGTSAVTLTYRAVDGHVGERLLYRDDEASLRLRSAGRSWAFDADGALFRLAAEARRIRLAYLFDPMLAVFLSPIEPLPHQIRAVYGEMLPRQPLRFLLADDPGAGKTIMAGLLIKELSLRGDLARCLIVAPGGLVTQWQDELVEKFGLHFDIVTRDLFETSYSGNPFDERHLLIARLDHLARNENVADLLSTTDWDLIVVDEAHRMSAHFFGNEVRKTKRYQLGELLGGISRHFLLMTATPHNGKDEDFQLFMGLLDADRFEGKPRDGVHADVSDLMRRMVKEKLLRFDGRKLFPERIATTVPYPLSDDEGRLYREVTDYVVEEMNRADRLRDAGEGRRGNRVGFALTVLQRRLASSPEAIYQSLVRRRKRLQARIEEERIGRLRDANPRAAQLDRLLGDLDEDPEGWDDLADEEVERLEEELLDEASAAQTIAELEYEITTLERLEDLAGKVRRSGQDRKWTELAALLHDDPAVRGPDGARRKLIVFTEHRDTLNYLVQRIRTLLGSARAVEAIHGGTSRDDRRRVQEVFSQDEECTVLVATDAAGEGINLQRAHLVVNYDLPWNPNRIEQRFGRVHRIGQTEVCHMWNLVAEDTREGQVYLRLLEKLEEQREALGGQVFDVLGDAFRGAPLRQLLLDAIRYGDQPEVRARLDEVIDVRIGDGLAELIDRQALAPDVMAAADVARIRADMEAASARRLQPRFVRAFFEEAFAHLGGRLREREPGRFQITHVPADLRSRDRQIGGGGPVLSSYERICFDKDLLHPVGAVPAELLGPGHPLLDVVLDLILERHAGLLKQGAVLVADGDEGETPTVLLFLEHSITDARVEPSGRPRIASKRFEFLTVDPAGEVQAAGHAPYLDYRPIAVDELSLVRSVLDAPWLRSDLDALGVGAAIAQAVPTHLAQIRARVTGRVERVRSAVKARLTGEINHWDHRANDLAEQAAAGKQPRMNPDRARARADDLEARLKRRMLELDQEQSLTALPPVVVGGALVIPRGLLDRVSGTRPLPPDTYANDTRLVERRAVDAVVAAEFAMGNRPEEMHHNNPGFDIQSSLPDGHLRFIEVKGRRTGASVVTVTRTEILFGLNAEDRHVLALVEVKDDGTDEIRYVRGAFAGIDGRIHFAETSRNFDWKRLWSLGTAPS